MKFLTLMFYFFAAVNSTKTCDNTPPENNCVSFTVGQGTGCSWMCNYCANSLGPNYYFTDNVCVYQEGGCVGNPIAGKTYTCCSN